MLLGTLFQNTYSQTDINLLRQINVHRNPKLDPAFLFITNTTSAVSLSVPVITYGVGLLQKNDSTKNKGLYIAGTIFTAGAIATTLKYTIKRPRPFVTYPDIVKLASAGSPSFPSGHTSLAFSTATSLSIAFPKWYVIAPSMIWASSVGYSRMHLGVHYPSDVLAGAIIGSGSAFLCNWLNKKLQSRSKS